METVSGVALVLGNGIWAGKGLMFHGSVGVLVPAPSGRCEVKGANVA